MLHHELMLTLLAYTMQTVHADWTQRGSDFLGESTSYAGGSVSISSDGLISTVGAPWGSGFAGTVRVYEFSAGAWNQLGSDIVGEASNDQSGISVSLSSDGSRVAIGAWENHVGAEDNAGHVRVYSYAASEWSQLGSDIDGEAAYDNFGISVSLNSDGSRVAIGAHGNDGTASGAGRVRVYSYAASAWGQLGGDMDGAAEDDGFGYSVSLNSDGTRVAIGGEACSYVRVYEFSGITWGQLGVNIDGTAADDFGWSVSISSDGTRVAIGAPENDEGGTNAGKVQVFEYAASSWSQMGNNILGTNSGSNSKGIGYSVSISSDGSRVAIGAPYFSPTVEGTEHSSAGMVRVVDYSGSDWSPLGSDIYGESVGSNQDNAGWSVALSADGRSVAVGSRGFNFYSGRARIYHDPGLTSAMGDPHITFAHGGSADFRGSHRTFYAFLTSPGFQFAPYFQEVDFWFDTVTGLRQLVHGTFMTEAAWRVSTLASNELLVKANAMQRGTLDLLLKEAVSQEVKSLAMGPWQSRTFDDVRVETRSLTVTLMTADWQVNLTAKPIYGLCPPLLNETHVHGHWEEEQRRFDIAIHGRFPQPDAHGIIGQSYQDDRVRNGKKDSYSILDAPALADSHGMLPPMTTSAQAEGAIEGVYTDYELTSPWSFEFRFSRFQFHRPRAHVDLNAAAVLKSSSTMEWDGKKGWPGRRSAENEV